MHRNKVDNDPIQVILVYIIHHDPCGDQAENRGEAVFERHLRGCESLQQEGGNEHADRTDGNPNEMALPTPNIGLPLVSHGHVAVDCHQHIKELEKAFRQNPSCVAQVGEKRRTYECERPAPSTFFDVQEGVEETGNDRNGFNNSVGGPKTRFEDALE